MMYQNYVFDLYGTLLDIHTDEWSKNFYKKYVKWLKKQGYVFEWKKFRKEYLALEQKARQNAKAAGVYQKPEIQIEEVVQEVFARKGYHLTEEEILFLCENYRRTSLIYLSLFPDTIACLEELKKAGKKIYLLSNAQRSFTWQELEQMGLVPYFDGILISSDEGCMKPDPAFYQILCDRYQLKKEECVMIGNELKSDMAGAAASGMDGFFINREALFREPKKVEYRYVSKNGSLMEVLEQTGIRK